MKANHIERDFLKTIREASPDDCKEILNLIQDIETAHKSVFIDDTGEYTDIGLLMGAIKEELMINGVLKTQFND